MPDTPLMSNPTLPTHRPSPQPVEAPRVSLVALRERKKDQTREALARAAFELFRTKGYEGTTVAEIARAANVSRRTFFRYYATKDALLFVEDSENLERFRELLGAPAPESKPLDRVRRACLALADDHMSEREQILARAQIIASSPVLNKQERQQDMLWEQAIAESLLSGNAHATPVAERRARVLGAAIFGAMRSTIAVWRELDGRADLPRLMDEAFDLFEPRPPVN